jgi:AraC-like DNA-binding protein
LKANFSRPLRIDDLATQANMSTSTFHHHFRTLTAMSPLQFQKSLRLNEARRLMLTEHQDATTAAPHVVLLALVLIEALRAGVLRDVDTSFTSL